MSEKIDINVADAETLTTISGIGPALAARIIEYRQTVHPFEEVIELTAVPGISEKMVRGFEALVTVQSVAPVDLEAQEGTPLLDTPEEMVLLDAPEPPAGLLSAELPEAASAEIEEEAVTIAEPDPETAVVDEEAVTEEVIEEPITPAEANAPATAVPAPPAPEVEPIPLAGSRREATPDPDIIAAAVAQQNSDWERKAQRRGCLSTLLGATFGAILGAVLTLAVLAALNQGTLNYSASDSALRQQLNTEIISRTNELNQLSTRVSVAATTEAEANQTLQSDFEASNEALGENIANNEEIISYLATRSGDLELRLQEVAGAADTFTSFLDGLRSLLGDLDESTPTPTPSAIDETVSPTPTPTFTPVGTSSPQPSATTAVSPTGAPTRTPLPTATPFTFPTNTPAPQP